MSSVYKNSKDPSPRPISPPPNPTVLGPRSKQLNAGNLNYHSTSLRTMVSNTVNKTALHPGGVQYVTFAPSAHRRHEAGLLT
jgi:hypothetical protein